MTAMRHKTDFVHIKRTRNIDEGSKAKNKNSKSVQHYSIGIFTELCLTQARQQKRKEDDSQGIKLDDRFFV